MRYQDRIAVVTGAGSGIGRALTVALTMRGAHVAASDIDDRGLKLTQRACRQGSVTTYPLDVADRAAVLDHAAQVERDLGSASLVFNNAGVDVMAPIADMSWEDLDWLTAINIGGVINGTKAFLPQLFTSGTAERPARLVNLSSAFGLIAIPYQGAYCTSKFAVRGLTEALREEMIMDGRHVTVHCVHPGVVRTNFGANMRTPEGDPAAQAVPEAFDRSARTTAERAAHRILDGMEKNRARILIGADGYLAAAMPRVLGAQYSDVIGRGAKIGLWASARRQSVRARG